MIPEIGHFALITALCLALLQATVPIIGAARGMSGWMAAARPSLKGKRCLWRLPLPASCIPLL